MEPRSDLFPMPDALLAAAMEWVTNPSAGERVNYYSAEDEVEEEQEVTAPSPGPVPKGPKAKGIPAGGQQPPGTGGGGKPGASSKMKKPTVATLASSVDALVTALPAISNQLAELTRRQAEVEQKFQQGTRISALAAPLGGTSTVGLSGASPKFHQMLSEMPPPRGVVSTAPVPKLVGAATSSASVRQEEVKQLEAEAELGSSDLARAVLAQSRALTALVGQIAQSADPLSDISSSSMSFSSRGAMGRTKLQQELSMQKGTFSCRFVRTWQEG